MEASNWAVAVGLMIAAVGVRVVILYWRWTIGRPVPHLRLVGRCLEPPPAAGIDCLTRRPSCSWSPAPHEPFRSRAATGQNVCHWRLDQPGDQHLLLVWQPSRKLLAHGRQILGWRAQPLRTYPWS